MIINKSKCADNKQLSRKFNLNTKKPFQTNRPRRQTPGIPKNTGLYLNASTMCTSQVNVVESHQSRTHYDCFWIEILVCVYLFNHRVHVYLFSYIFGAPGLMLSSKRSLDSLLAIEWRVYNSNWSDNTTELEICIALIGLQQSALFNYTFAVFWK